MKPGNTEVVVELIKAGVNLNLQDKVQRLSILCMFTTYIQHMMYTNKTTLHVIFRCILSHTIYIYSLIPSSSSPIYLVCDALVEVFWLLCIVCAIRAQPAELPR